MKLRSMELCVKDAKPDEIELDFFAFKLSTLRWLQDFVKPYQGNIDEKSNQNVMENDVTGQAKEHNFVSDHTSPQSEFLINLKLSIIFFNIFIVL